MPYLFSFVVFQVMIFFALTCRCQSYYFKHYLADDGLAHNAVSVILQDKKGLMWIGTRGGLNRFDGYTFKTYKNKDNTFGNIGNNVITALVEDHRGMLWIGTGKGIFMFDPFKEVFSSIESAPQDYINHIAIDKENNIYFLAEKRLFQYFQTTKKLVDRKMEASCLAIDAARNLWMGDDEGQIKLFNPETKRLSLFRIFDPKVPANLRSISRILPISENELLIGCFKQGLKSYRLDTKKISSVPLTNVNNTNIYVRDVIKTGQQEYWIATESGIYIYNHASHTTQNLRKQAGDPYSLADNAVYSIYKDSQGGIWAGTFFGGLSYHSEENAKFEKYYPVQGINSISGSAVREICADSWGNLWIGTEDAGLNKFNPKTKQFTHFSSGLKNTELSYPNIHGLLAVGHQLFIGPFLNGLEIMDMRSGVITDRFKLIGDEGSKKSDFVLSIYLSKDSNLMVGTAYNNSGLFDYDRKNKKFKRIQQIPFKSHVLDIHEDHKGNIWTGSADQGTFYFDPKTGKRGNIRFGDQTKSGFINEFPVYGILEDSNHAMWFCTEGGGLIRLSPDRKTIKKFTTENGLPSNVFFRILEDESKQLWISSLKGLIRLDLASEKFTVYTQSNGLITDQFNFNSAYKDAKGKMYFGSVKGMISFDPKDFRYKSKAPPTYITGFQVGPLQQSILYTDSVVLAHDQSTFSIEFAALDYSSPDQTRYEFQMEGLDNSKTYLSKNRKAYFTDLSAGEYTFIVRAKSNTGSWTGRERRLSIQILPPIWQSSMAYFIYVLVIAGCLWGLIRYYHRYLDRKNQHKLILFEHEKEKEIYHAKIEFFTHIAHEIQTPLTLILGPIERMVRKTGEQIDMKKSLTMIEKNAKRLAELTGQLLDFRKTEMNQFGLSFVNTDINHLLNEQITAFKQEAEKKNISLSLELPTVPITLYADNEALVKICSNLISNAIKYAATEARVKVFAVGPADEQLRIRFINDGRGIPIEFRNKIFEPFFRLPGTDVPGTGIGLSLAKSLAELHNGYLKLLEGSDSVIFELTLPLHQAVEFKLSSWKTIK